ncbi:DNRLRE domain-containing protein [bacterium]|nr:DNRLRE domain-containing protein [bacterium]
MMNKLYGWIFLLFLLCIPGLLLAWGPRTHMEIVRMSRVILDDVAFPELPDFIDDYRGAIFSGSIFPDWAFVVVNDTFSWHAHATAFGELYLNHLLQKFPDMSTPTAQQELAFLMGLLAHIYSDRVWHGGTGEHSALIEGMYRDATSEEVIEGALDVIIAYESTIESFSWFWPNETIREVYFLYGDSNVTEDDLALGTNGLEILYNTAMATGYFSYLASKAAIPWTYENYVDYYPGGMTNAAHLTALKMRKDWAQAVKEAYIFQRSHYNCGYQITGDVHLLEAYPYHNTGFEPRLVASSSDSSQKVSLLLDWNISGMDTSGYMVDSAAIYLFYEGLGEPISGNKLLQLYRMNRSWTQGIKKDEAEDTYWGAPLIPGERYACWTHAFYDDRPWTQPGALAEPEDHDTIVQAELTFNSASPLQNWFKWDITTAAIDWLSGEAYNLGLLLKESPNTATGQILFASRDAQETSYHPMMVIYMSETPVNINENLQPETIPDFRIVTFPNPFNSNVTIELPGDADFRIFDLQGKNRKGDGTVYKINPSLYRWSPGARVPAGLYIIEVRHRGTSKSHRLIYLK